MTNYEKTVLRKIIYAVETGGQVYGRQDYASFISAGTNTDNEVAITIGAGQWYGANAKKLLNRIRQAYPTTFAALDTAGIATDLDASDWSGYNLSASSAKAKCIIKIIDSEAGHVCQDALMDEEMEQYVNGAAELGVTAMDAKMMCANFWHHGGRSAVVRILGKTPTPYTLDGLYNACQTDTGNQVGTYRSRQDMVYSSLKQYITNYEVTPEAAVEAVVSICREEVGYLEKASNANLDSKKGNAGSNNYTKYWRDLDASLQGSSWCACFVSWVLKKAFGQAVATAMLDVNTFPYVWVDDMRTYHSDKWSTTPTVGSLVIFWKENLGRYGHVGFVVDVDGDNYTTVEGNTSADAGVVSEGQGVYEKHYTNDVATTRFIPLDYTLVTSINSGGIGETPNTGEDSFKVTGIAYCTGNGVRVRATPGGTVLGGVDEGGVVEVDGVISGDWVHVKVPGIGIGYMHKDYLSYESDETANWTKTGIATCTANKVRVRKTPNGTIIGKLNKGDQFEIDGTQSGVWVHVKVSGIGIGYMHQDYVSTSSDWVKTGTAYCTGDGVRIRATPGGDILGKLYVNDTFEVDGKRSGEWVHIKATGIGVGYIHQDYVAYTSVSTGNVLVKKAQMALNSYFDLGVDVDGSWGPASQKAYIMAIQTALNNEYGESLDVDGGFGAKTKAAITAHVISRGTKNTYAAVLQIGLLAHGYDLSNGVDASFGPATETAVINYQTSVGILANGKAGIDTFTHLAGKA